MMLNLAPKGESKEVIEWYLNGEKVGSADLPEGTSGSDRDLLAYLSGVNSYDNFKFVNRETGEVRIDASDVTKLLGYGSWSARARFNYEGLIKYLNY